MAVPNQLTPTQWAQSAKNAFTGALASAQVPISSTAALAVMGVLFATVGWIAFGLQQMAVYVDTAANLLTAYYEDAVTLLAAWGFLPQSAVPATTLVTMGVNSPSNQPQIIPFGLIFTRADGTQYELIEDDGQPNYSPNGYILAANALTLTGPVECLTPGSIGNTDAGTITTLPTGVGTSSASIITSVTNLANVTNGLDAETLPALIARFQAWVAGGNYGTAPALLQAALGTQAGLTVSVCDCLDANGNLKLAWSTIFVNALGNAAGPSQSLLTNVGVQVEAKRAAGMQFAMAAPTINVVNVSMLVRLDGTVSQPTVFAAIAVAVSNYINGVGMQPIQKPGGITTLYVSFSQLFNAIVGRDSYGNLFIPGIAFIDNLLLNGSSASIALGYGHQAVAGSITCVTE